MGCKMLAWLIDLFCCCDDYELTPEDLGIQGENAVIKYSKPRFLEFQMQLNDYNFRSKDGVSRQIDHIILRRNGIFVIETKNFSGTIYGNENNSQWTQVLGYGKEKHKFYSPVKQNETHVRKIKEILGKDAPVFSIVVFVNGNIDFLDIENVYDLDGYRDRLLNNYDYYLDDDEIIEYYDILVEHEEDIDKEDHIRDVNKFKKR